MTTCEFGPLPAPGAGARRAGPRPHGSPRYAGVLLGMAGAALVLSALWQTWGTGLSQARSQERLGERFEADTPTLAGAPPAPLPPAGDPPPPPPGTPVARLAIPSIGLENVVVEGTAAAELAGGPGHYVGTPLPGRAGNAAIAGHRTTHGAPFFKLGRLRPGDRIEITTPAGRSVYEVVGSRQTVPTDLSPLAPTPDSRLTLTTCDPPFRATRRLIVVATLKSEDSVP